MEGIKDKEIQKMEYEITMRGFLVARLPTLLSLMFLLRQFKDVGSESDKWTIRHIDKKKKYHKELKKEIEIRFGEGSKRNVIEPILFIPPEYLGNDSTVRQRELIDNIKKALWVRAVKKAIPKG